MIRNFNNTNVAITGGAGLIGSFLVDHLVEDGAKVIVIDDFSKGSKSNLKDHLNNIEIREGNLEDINFAKQSKRISNYIEKQATCLLLTS